MRPRWLIRVVQITRNLRYLPAIVRMAVDLVEVAEDVGREDFVAAERRLLRVYEAAPPRALEHSPTHLLMAVVHLRLGNPSAAVDLLPTAVRHVRGLTVYANAAERAYLCYAGRLAFEEATTQLREPLSLDVGVEYEDIDLRRVRSSIRDIYPVRRSTMGGRGTIH